MFTCNLSLCLLESYSMDAPTCGHKELPPKVLHWHEYQVEEAVAISHNLPHWVDDLLDFSSGRQGSHRRSMSDSVAFMDAEEHRRSCIPPHNAKHLNDFTTKSEPEEEVHTSCFVSPSHVAPSTEKIADPKRIKRILANRQSAQRSRVRKLQYISELERSVSSLQAEVSVLSPRVAYLDHQRLMLNVDNSALKERIAALSHDKIFKDAHQEALKGEIERLRQVYYQQNLKMTTDTAPESTPNGTFRNNCSPMEERMESSEHIDESSVV